MKLIEVSAEASSSCMYILAPFTKINRSPSIRGSPEIITIMGLSVVFVYVIFVSLWLVTSCQVCSTPRAGGVWLCTKSTSAFSVTVASSALDVTLFLSFVMPALASVASDGKLFFGANLSSLCSLLYASIFSSLFKKVCSHHSLLTITCHISLFSLGFLFVFCVFA